MSTNDLFYDQFERWQEKRGDNRIELVNEGHRREEESNGAIWSLNHDLEKTGAECPKMVLACDAMIDRYAQDLVDYSREKESPITCVYDVGDLEKARALGIVSVNSRDIITRFVEKPEYPESTLASLAFYVFPAESLGRVDEYLTKGHDPKGIGRFLEWLHKKEPVYVLHVEVFVHITDIKSLKRAQKAVKELVGV